MQRLKICLQEVPQIVAFCEQNVQQNLRAKVCLAIEEYFTNYQKYTTKTKFIVTWQNNTLHCFYAGLPFNPQQTPENALGLTLLKNVGKSIHYKYYRNWNALCIHF